jgi:hypothetical protein
MIRKKQIAIIKIMTKVNIKIKFLEKKLKNKYSKRNIYIYIYIVIKSLRIKFDIINK